MLLFVHRKAPRIEDVETAMRRLFRRFGLQDARAEWDPDGGWIWRYERRALPVEFRVRLRDERSSELAARFSVALGTLPAADENRPGVLATYRRLLELNYEQIAVGALGVRESLLVYDHVFDLDRDTFSDLGEYLEWLAEQARRAADELRALAARIDEQAGSAA